MFASFNFFWHKLILVLSRFQSADHLIISSFIQSFVHPIILAFNRLTMMIMKMDNDKIGADWNETQKQVTSPPMNNQFHLRQAPLTGDVWFARRGLSDDIERTLCTWSFTQLKYVKSTVIIDTSHGFHFSCNKDLFYELSGELISKITPVTIFKKSWKFKELFFIKSLMSLSSLRMSVRTLLLGLSRLCLGRPPTYPRDSHQRHLSCCPDLWPEFSTRANNNSVTT